MATAVQVLTGQITPFANGVAAVTTTEENYSVVFSGTWVAGDVWTVILTDQLTGLQTQVGDGFVSGIVPTFALTYDDKVYILSGSTVYMSAIDAPATWNDPNASGNGFITLTNWYSTTEPIISMSVYQGKLAFFSRWTVQIWNTDANLANWSIEQTLPNIGTLAPQSVQSLGDLDVIFLSDTGIRSLRARDITLNAFINDIGSPLDPIIQNALLAGNYANACSGVEPATGRYMLFLNGVIYVLSYYPSNKILAWSTYLPTDSNGGVFTPFQMVVFQGAIWFYGLDSNGNQAAYQYGGANNNTYDRTRAKWQTGFLDAKTAGTIKGARAVDVVINSGQGGMELDKPDSWSVYCSMDQKSAGDPTQGFPGLTRWKNVYNSKASSFDIQTLPYSDKGTHFSVYAQSNGDGNNGAGGPATFSEVLLHYEPDNEKG